MSRAEEESVQTLATKELLEYCAVTTESLPEQAVEAVVNNCSIGGELTLTALTAVSKMAKRSETKSVLVDKGVVRDIVTLAKNCSDENKMQAIHALATLATDDLSLQNAVREADGLTLLLPLFTSSFTEHLEMALTAMTKLCKGCPGNSRELCLQGCIEALMKLIDSPSADIRERAAKALQPLVQSNDDAQAQVLRAGGVDKFLNYVHDPRMQSFSFEMLQMLASSASQAAAFSSRFVSGVGVPSMLKILRDAHEERILTIALSLLTHVVNNNSDIGDRMHEASYMSALPRLMQHNSASIRSQATFLIKVLSLSQTHTQASPEFFTSCMNLLVGMESGDVVSAREAKVLAAESMRNYSRWPHNAPACWQALEVYRHALPQLVQLVQTSTRDGVMESSVTAMLACLTSHTDQIQVSHLTVLQEAGVHHALISALSSPHLDVQKGSAATLANMMGHATVGPQLREEVFRFGGVPLLKSLLSKGDEQLQEAAVSALASLAQLREAADQIDLQPFIHLLKSSGGSHMQAATMSIVGQITQQNDFKQQQLMDAGTLPAIVDMMHSPDPGVQRTAIKQVCMFATDSANWPTIRNGFPKLVEMLSSHDPSVVHETSECIANMVVDADNARAFLSCGGHMSLVPLLSRASLEVQRHAAAATAAMARTGGMPVVQAMVEAGAVKPLVELLRNGTGKGDKHAQTLAQDALQALAMLSQDPRAASHIGSTCLDVLFTLVEQYDEGVQQQAVYLLLNVANVDQQVRNKMVQTSRTGVMLRFMSSTHEEAQEIGVKALAALLGDGKNGPKTVTRLIVEPAFMTTLMGTFSAEGKTVREFASVIVTNLLNTKAFRTKFVAEGGFGALNKLVTLNKDSTTKTRNGVAAMEILMKDGDLDFELQKDSNERQVIESFIDQLSDARSDSGGSANTENVIGILARLSSQESCISGLARKPAALRTLLHQLAAGITKDALKENILRIVSNCCQDEDCAVTVVRLEGYVSACSAIKLSYRGQNSTKLQIRRLGIAALVAMAQHQKCRFTMAQNETLPMLVDVLSKSADDKELLLSTTRCAVELTKSMPIAEKLVEERALEQILAILNELVAAPPAISSMGGPPSYSAAASPLASDAPVAATIAQLNDSERRELTESTASCLASFALCTEAVDVICGAGDLLEATTSALDHMRSMVSLLTMNNTQVQLSICTALEVLAVDNICREALCQAAGVDCLVGLLQNEDHELRLTAGRVLIKLANSDSGRASILRSSVDSLAGSGADSVPERAGFAVTALVSMLSQLDEPSVKVASELLCSLSCSDEGRQAIGLAEGIPSLIHVMRNFDNEELAMNILTCLLNLGFLRDNRVMLRDPDFLDVLRNIESSGEEVMIPMVKRLRRTIGGNFYPSTGEAETVLDPLPPEPVTRAATQLPSQPPSHYPGATPYQMPAPGTNGYAAPGMTPGFQSNPYSGFNPSMPYGAMGAQQAPPQPPRQPVAMPQHAAMPAYQPPTVQPPAVQVPTTYHHQMGQPLQTGRSPSLVPPVSAPTNSYPTRPATTGGDVPFGMVPSSVSGAGTSGGGGGSTHPSDEEMARRLQQQFDAESSGPAPAPAPSPAPEPVKESDEEMARRLQAQFDEGGGGDAGAAQSDSTGKKPFWRRK